MTFFEAKHWTDILVKDDLREEWEKLAPNFGPKELACRSDGSLHIEKAALGKLQALREAVGKPLTINSAYRTPAHNRRVGGSPRSQHVMGTAFDVSLAGGKLDGDLLERLARGVGFAGIGRYDTFIHVDNRAETAYWDLRKR